MTGLQIGEGKEKRGWGDPSFFSKKEKYYQEVSVTGRKVDIILSNTFLKTCKICNIEIARYTVHTITKN